MKFKQIIQAKHDDGWYLDMKHQMSHGQVAMVLDSPDRDRTFQTLLFTFDHKEGKWVEKIIYEGYEGDVAMSHFDSYLTKEITDPLDGLKFDCPSCSGHIIEACQDGYHVSRVTCIDEEGDHEYGELTSEGEVTRWQCEGCGYVLQNQFEDITDNVEVAEWIKEHCK